MALPEPVFANIGKLLLGTQIYDMHRLAHEVSGGMIVTLPGPDEDHNPATAGRISEVLTARSDIPYQRRIEVARFIEDLTASYQGGWYSIISLHGGGSPEAMKREIHRRYPIAERVALVARLLDRGIHATHSDPRWFGRQRLLLCRRLSRFRAAKSVARKRARERRERRIRFDRNVAIVLARSIFFVKVRRLFFRGSTARQVLSAHSGSFFHWPSSDTLACDQ